MKSWGAGKVQVEKPSKCGQDKQETSDTFFIPTSAWQIVNAPTDDCSASLNIEEMKISVFLLK